MQGNGRRMANLGKIVGVGTTEQRFRLRWETGGTESVTPNKLDKLLLRRDGSLLGYTIRPVSAAAVLPNVASRL